MIGNEDICRLTEQYRKLTDYIKALEPRILIQDPEHVNLLSSEQVRADYEFFMKLQVQVFESLRKFLLQQRISPLDDIDPAIVALARDLQNMSAEETGAVRKAVAEIKQSTPKSNVVPIRAQ